MNTIQIQGMKCQHCAATVQKELEALGLSEVRIDLAKGVASYEGEVALNQVKQAIAAKGFEVIS